MWLVVLGFVCVGLSDAKNSYLVSVPNAVVPGTPLGFHVNILEASSKVRVKATLKFSLNGSVVVEHEKTASEGHSTAIDLAVPESLAYSDYKVAVTGSGGLNFYKESDIYFDRDNFLFVFIQTDKFRYSAGQTVYFRVIFLNPNLVGYTGAFDVSVKDQKGNKLQQWLSQTTNDGVFQGSLTISDDPEDGTWTIVASVKGKTQKQEFKVSPYTLPKFKVSVDVKKIIHSKEKSINIDVSARFTFKQPVYGLVVLQIYNEDTPTKVKEYKDQIQGHASFEVPMKDIMDKLTDGRKIIVRAIVTDEATFLTMAAETPLNIVRDFAQISIKRWEKRERFVPGLPYFVQFLVRKDGAEIGVAGNLEVKVYSVTYRLADCPYSQPKVQQIKYITKTLISTSIPFGNSGLAALTVDTPYDAIKLKVRIFGPSESSLTYDLKRVLPSDMNNLLRLSMESPPEIGETVSVRLTATRKLKGSVMFEVYCRGRRLLSKEERMNAQVGINFQLSINSAMVPKAYILAYFMGDDGTIASDGLPIEVEGSKIRNTVSVQFDKETAEVGEDVNLSIQANPGSTVYILTEDERNRLLGTSNDIFLYQVEDKVDATAYDIEDNIRNYPKQSGVEKRSSFFLDRHRRDFDAYGDTDDSFIKSGVIIMTDGKVMEKTVIEQDVTDKYSTSCPRRGVGWMTQSLGGFKTLSLGGGPVNSPNFFQGGGPINSPNFFQGGGPVNSPNFFQGENSSSLKQYITSLSRSTAVVNSAKSPHEALDVQANQDDQKAVADIVRRLFPETWLWDSFQIGPTGSLSVPQKVPDSVTSWETSAFATNMETGFGVAKNTSKLTVFRDFFVTLDMPSTIVFGEEFLLQVTVFNYLSKTHTVILQITHSDDPNDMRAQATEVAADEGHSVFVYITPTISGDITISVRAQAGMFWPIYAQDNIERNVYVQPRGLWYETNVPQLIDVSDVPFRKTLLLKMDPNMVPDTRTMKLSLTGDFMLPSIPSIEGLQDFIRLPYGCGEQTMIRFAPNVYITDYLEVAEKLTNDIRRNSKHFMENGYQRELTYQRTDGSFSAFGNSDPSGSSWLTAFVLKCFHEARNLIFIDEDVMTKAMTWLLTTQRSDGQFTEPGRVIHREMQSGTTSDIKITSFIVIALLENKDLQVQRLPSAIAKGIDYIERNLHMVRDSYTLTMVCYTLSMGQSNKATTCAEKLKQSSILEDGALHWKSNTPVSISRRGMTKRANQGNQRAPAKDIEATAYALLFYLSQGKVVESLQIVKWLVSQRNPRGGYLSTQDTVISLQAISMYASFRSTNSPPEDNFGIDFKITSGDFLYEYSLTDVNKDILHVKKLPANLQDVKIEATGFGTAFVEVSSGYYVSSLQSNGLLNVTATLKQESLNSITVDICTRWFGNSPTGMVVAEVELPTGFIPDEDLLKSQESIRRNEMKGKAINLYFDSIPAKGEVCVNVKSDRSDPVVKSQACHVTVYDYYEPENQAMTEYESGILKTANICDVCFECNFCNNPLVG